MNHTKNINILPIESYQSFVPPVDSGHLQTSQARHTQNISLHSFTRIRKTLPRLWKQIPPLDTTCKQFSVWFVLSSNDEKW